MIFAISLTSIHVILATNTMLELKLLSWRCLRLQMLNLPTFTFDFVCRHLMSDKTFMQKYLKHCQRMVPYVRLYQKQVQYYNHTAYNILQNEINLILPTFTESNRKKRFLSAVFGTVASQFVGLAFEGISSVLYHKMHKALHKAIKQINERQNIEHNRIYHLEDTMIMYGKYNSDTLTNLIDMVHRMHNLTSLKEKLFVGKVNEWLKQQLTHYNDEHSYSIIIITVFKNS